MLNKNSKIYIAGHRGLVGSAIHRLLKKEGYTNIITRTSKELDLTNQEATNSFIYTDVRIPPSALNARTRGLSRTDGKRPYDVTMTQLVTYLISIWPEVIRFTDIGHLT